MRTFFNELGGRAARAARSIITAMEEHPAETMMAVGAFLLLGGAGNEVGQHHNITETAPTDVWIMTAGGALMVIGCALKCITGDNEDEQNDYAQLGAPEIGQGIV